MAKTTYNPEEVNNISNVLSDTEDKLRFACKRFDERRERLCSKYNHSASIVLKRKHPVLWRLFYSKHFFDLDVRCKHSRFPSLLLRLRSIRHDIRDDLHKYGGLIRLIQSAAKLGKSVELSDDDWSKMLQLQCYLLDNRVLKVMKDYKA